MHFDLSSSLPTCSRLPLPSLRWFEPFLDVLWPFGQFATSHDRFKPLTQQIEVHLVPYFQDSMCTWQIWRLLGQTYPFSVMLKIGDFKTPSWAYILILPSWCGTCREHAHQVPNSFGIKFPHQYSFWHFVACRNHPLAFYMAYHIPFKLISSPHVIQVSLKPAVKSDPSTVKIH